MKTQSLLIVIGLAFLTGLLSAPAMAGDVLWYTGNSGSDGGGHSDIVALLQTVGATVDVNDNYIFDLTGYKLVFIVLPGFYDPGHFFTADEKAVINTWLQTASHRIVVVGDWYPWYYGEPVMNDLLAAIGSPLVFVPGGWDMGCGHCSGPLGQPDPLTQGLSHVCRAATSTWDPAYGKPLAYPEDPTAPGPWLVTNSTLIPNIVGIGDASLLNDGCHYLGAGGDADSKIFVTRLYTSGSSSVETPGAPEIALTRIDPAWPNPGRGPIHLSFSLATPRMVRATIYNLSGERVRTLLNGPLPGGRSIEVWDGKDEYGRPVGSGIYMLGLDAGNAERRQKIVVVR